MSPKHAGVSKIIVTSNAIESTARHLPVSGRPVERVGKFDVLRVVGAFQEVHHIDLMRRSWHGWWYVVIFVQDQIRSNGLLPSGRDAARRYWTFGIVEHIPTGFHVPRSQSVVEEDRFQLTLALDGLVIGWYKHQLIGYPITA